MNAKYFLYLYLRNAKGIFLNGFVDSATYQYAAPLVWLTHICLLPVTLTVGAIFKSIFDFITRKSIPEATLSERKEAILSMEKEELSKVVADILAYNAKSNSSHMLVQELTQLEISANKAIARGHASKKYSLALDQLDDKEQKKYQPKYISTLQLDHNHKIQLDEYDTANQNQVDMSKLQQQKALITNYMELEKNQGKKMLQIIVGMFKESEAIIETVDNQSKEISYLQTDLAESARVFI